MAQDSLNLTYTPGGIPVIVERLPYFRSVALSVNVSVGSRDEPQNHCGIAHLLEHLMFKGTRERSTKEISEIIEGAGGELNGYTTKEITSFHVFSLDETVETAQNILSDMIVNPLIDEEHVELERNVVTQEINMMVDEPEGMAGVTPIILSLAWASSNKVWPNTSWYLGGWGLSGVFLEISPVILSNKPGKCQSVWSFSASA